MHVSYGKTINNKLVKVLQVETVTMKLTGMSNLKTPCLY